MPGKHFQIVICPWNRSDGDFERPIHAIMKLKTLDLVGYVPFKEHKNYIMIFMKLNSSNLDC